MNPFDPPPSSPHELGQPLLQGTSAAWSRRYRPLPRWLRLVSTALVPVYALTSLPGYLLAQADEAAKEVTHAVAESFKPAPPVIHVNHTLPAGVTDDSASPSAAQPAPLHFSSPTPKDSEFFQARLFVEPLVPTDAKAVPGENESLAKALLAFSQTSTKPSADAAERVAPLRLFLDEYPKSRWAMSLWLNLGLTYRTSGYWTRALNAWEQAWAAGKKVTSPNARALADRAVAELAELNARLGRYERLQPLFDELDAAGRELRGSAAEKLAGARQGLWLMNNHPEAAFRCGPMALNCLRLAENPKASFEPKLADSKSTRQGISLSQVAALSREIKRPMQMAFRAADKEKNGVSFITPSVVHWKAGHYAALVEEKGDRYRVDDPTFGDTSWVSRAALEAESDGYFLVAANLPLPGGWKSVSEEEGSQVWGKGNTGSKNPNATKVKDARCKTCPRPYGMATYNIEAMLTSLAIGDTPLSYTPPRGSPISFGMQYSQHEASQPAVPTYWNMGPKWSSEWLSYIEDNANAQWAVTGYYPEDGGNGSTVYYPIFTLAGGVTQGPLPITHLAGGGTESYQGALQISAFVPADKESMYFTFVAQDQPVVSGMATVSGIAYEPPGGGSIVADYGDPIINIDIPYYKRPRLQQRGDSRYERYLPNGTVETFGHSDQATTYPRRVFLTERKDPSGNTTTFSYDNSNRLVAVTDALGQVTTLSYELGSDPLKVTRVTDPFGRSCQLAYNADGELISIIDTAGIQSSFTYADNDFIDSLTTPYGSSTFAFGDVTTDPTMGINAWVEATDPYGDTERAEYRHGYAPGVPGEEAVVPQGIPTWNIDISDRNTFYWDKKALKDARANDGSLDYNKAHIFHFLHDVDYNVTSGILESTKSPLENRVWLSYQDQSSPRGVTYGMSQQPSLVARVLDDGSTQLYQYQYNDQQRVTKATDPLGRETTYDYDPANNMDLLSVRRTTGGLNEYLMGATYNAAHQPLKTTDAAGQTTTLTYNSAGQVQTITDATQRTATLQYNSQGYLQEIDGYDPTIKSTYSYDGFGRLASTTTYPDAYTVQIGYDAVGGNPLATLDRSTTITHPDGSYTEIDYTNLDVEWMRDRSGNWTHLLTNKLRELEASIDPLGQVTQYGYCKCGQLVKVIDPNGNVTQWRLDAQERPAAKVYADNTEINYTFENTTSRLKQVTDAKGQHTNYSYYLDGSLQSVTHTNAEHPTSGASYTYDPQRGRLATMTDVVGTATYSYYPLGNGGTGTLGAGRLQSVSGPFDNQSVNFEYDQLGRTTKRTVNGVDENYSFDALGRLQTDTNALGSFTYNYDGASSRLTGILYPNGQQTQYSYLPSNEQEHRLSQIKHLAPTGAAFDQFDYTYDESSGRVAHWGQQQPGTLADSTATNNYDLSYDAGGRLKRAILNGDSNNAGSGVWSYDAAGNRTGVQTGGGTLSTAVPTSTNAIFSLRGGGKVRVAGALSEWATVTVNGHDASFEASNNTFEAFVPMAMGLQTLAINATDSSGNTATSRYQLAISAGAGEDFAYDASGNTIALTPADTSVTAQSLEWDACNRVTAINQGGHRTEFGYDGQGNRVRITEKDAGQFTSDHLYVAGEERDAATGQVLRRFFGQGEQRLAGGSANYFYAGDHLGSTRALTDNSGSIRASYGYDLWGARSKLRGDLDTEIGFTGYWHHAASGLEVSPTRLYQASLGRFLSQDPLQEGGGQLNLFAYCANDPINRSDPTGMDFNSGLEGAVGAAIGFAVAGAALAAVAVVAGELGLGLSCGALATLGLLAAGALLYELGKTAYEQWTGKDLWSGCPLSGDELDRRMGAALVDGALGLGGLAMDALGLCFTAGTGVLEDKGTVPIGTMRVGERVTARDGNGGTSAVDPETWKEVTLQMANGEAVGDTFDIHALRSPEWLAAENCVRAGNRVWFEMSEMGLSGWATVKEIAACPPLANGSGDVVLTTVNHFNCDVYRLRLAGTVQPLEPTGQHQLYSATRGGWVAASTLQAGERLQTRTGERTIASIERLPGTYRVYNLEVEREHCYFVGNAQVLAHNACSENLASAQRTNHILHGDSTGGGHLYPGASGKTPFPANWSSDDIMSAVSDVATDPSLTWKPQTGSGGFFTKAGDPARFSVEGSRNGVNVKVIVEPAGEGIITAFPK